MNATEMFLRIPLDALDGADDNVRADLGDLEELARSIRESGVLQALTVQPADECRWRVIAGHRRLAAARLAGVPTVPCMVRTDLGDNADRVSAMLTENLHRRDLSPMEEARAYKALSELGLSQRKIAGKVARTQAHVSRRIALAELPGKFQRLVDTGGITLDQAVLITQMEPEAFEILDAEISEDASKVEAWQISSARAEVEANERWTFWLSEIDRLVTVGRYERLDGASEMKRPDGYNWPRTVGPTWNGADATWTTEFGRESNVAVGIRDDGAKNRAVLWFSRLVPRDTTPDADDGEDDAPVRPARVPHPVEVFLFDDLVPTRMQLEVDDQILIADVFAVCLSSDTDIDLMWTGTSRCKEVTDPQIAAWVRCLEVCRDAWLCGLAEPEDDDTLYRALRRVFALYAAGIGYDFPSPAELALAGEFIVVDLDNGPSIAEVRQNARARGGRGPADDDGEPIIVGVDTPDQEQLAKAEDWRPHYGGASLDYFVESAPFLAAAPLTVMRAEVVAQGHPQLAEVLAVIDARLGELGVHVEPSLFEATS